VRGADAVLRPAAGSVRRVPALCRRGRGAAQSGGQLHDEGHAGHAREHPDGGARSTPQDAPRARGQREPRRGGGSGGGRSRHGRPSPRLRESGAVHARRALRRGRPALRGRPVREVQGGGRRQSVHPPRLRPLHLLLPLRARLRRAGGGLRDQRRQPRLPHADHDRVRQQAQRLLVHVLRAVRADLADRCARRQEGDAHGRSSRRATRSSRSSLRWTAPRTRVPSA
jgi:hypothetical protein